MFAIAERDRAWRQRSLERAACLSLSLQPENTLLFRTALAAPLPLPRRLPPLKPRLVGSGHRRGEKKEPRMKGKGRGAAEKQQSRLQPDSLFCWALPYWLARFKVSLPSLVMPAFPPPPPDRILPARQTQITVTSRGHYFYRWSFQEPQLDKRPSGTTWSCR